MRRTLHVALLSLRLLARDRTAFIWMFAIPLALTAIMGLTFGGGGASKTEVALVDSDAGYYSREVSRIVRNEKSLHVAGAMSLSKARKAVKANEISAAIVMPKGFGARVEDGKPVEIQLVALQGSSQTPAISQLLTGIADRVSSDAQAADFAIAEAKRRERKVEKKWQDANDEQRQAYEAAKAEALANAASLPPAMLAMAPQAQFPPPPPAIKKWWKPVQDNREVWRGQYKKADKEWEPKPPVEVREQTVRASKVRGEKTTAQGFGQTSLGFTLTFVLYGLLSNSSGILEERRLGTLGRLLTTPTRKMSIVTGKILGLYATGVVQAAILVIAGIVLFKVNWGANLPAVAVILAAFIFAGAGLGTLLSTLARTLAQAQAFVPIISISISMLGGVFWPIEIVPPVMRQIANFTPVTWAMSSLIDVTVRNRGFEVVGLPALILVAFGALFFAVSLPLLKLE